MDAQPHTFRATTRPVPRAQVRPARSLHPFTYETDAVVIEDILASLDGRLRVVRQCIATAMRSGDRELASAFRVQVARFETAIRNGHERKRWLAAARAAGVAVATYGGADWSLVPPTVARDIDEPQSARAEWGMA